MQKSQYIYFQMKISFKIVDISYFSSNFEITSKTRLHTTRTKLSRKEASMMRHLANAHYLTGPAGIVYRMVFSVVWRDRSRRLERQLSIG